MKVPFFRSKDKTSDSSSIRGGSSKAAKVVSDSDLTVRPASAALARAPYSSPSVSNISGGQLGEMQGFLSRINGFQGEAQRLFPENTALDHMLNELRDECQRRVDYMTRVSAPPAWMATPPAQTRALPPAQPAATHGR
ncbi:hypothetical protein IWW50_003665, partial [Coemansia erecta]